MSATAPPPPPLPSSLREPRIDVLRGLALMVIYWDHVMGHARVSSVPLLITPLYTSFWDGAEVFVFLAGAAFAHAYAPVARSAGLGAALARAIGRSLQLYAAHIVTLTLALAAVTVIAMRTHAVPWALQDFFEDPISLLPEIALLRYLPLTFGILPLYMLLVPYGVLVLALARRGPALPLGLGFGLWLVAQAVPSWSPPRLLPELTGIGRWEFNPLAWQILFTLGLTLTLQASARGPLVRPRRWLDLLAVALVVAGPVIKLGSVLAVAPDALRTLDWGPARDLLLARLVPGSAKPTLGPVRLLSFAAVLWLVVRALPVTHPLWHGRVARLLALLGRQALQVFCLSTGLAVVVHALAAATGGGLARLLGWTGLGAALCAGHAAFRGWVDSGRRTTQAPRQLP